jgi:hypothetical protein
MMAHEVAQMEAHYCVICCATICVAVRVSIARYNHP